MIEALWSASHSGPPSHRVWIHVLLSSMCFWVVRVSLLGMSSPQVVAFREWLLKTGCAAIAKHAKHTEKAVKSRDAANGKGIYR